jgi:hypothetical protein
MLVERREQAIAIRIGSTGNGRNPIVNGRRQPSCDGTSRMNREVHVRICERLGVKRPGPTRQQGQPRFAPKQHYDRSISESRHCFKTFGPRRMVVILVTEEYDHVGQ